MLVSYLSIVQSYLEKHSTETSALNSVNIIIVKLTISRLSNTVNEMRGGQSDNRKICLFITIIIEFREKVSRLQDGASLYSTQRMDRCRSNYLMRKYRHLTSHKSLKVFRNVGSNNRTSERTVTGHRSEDCTR